MLHSRFREAFEETFDVDFTEFDGKVSGLIRDLGVTVVIDPETDALTLSTPVRDAHDGLPRADLLHLLRFNMPNPLAGPFFLEEARGSGWLELTGTVPLAAIAPPEVERLVLDHWSAASTIGDGLDERFHLRKAEGR